MHDGHHHHHHHMQVHLQHQCHQIMFAMRGIASQQQQISLQYLIQFPEQLPLYKKHLFGLSPMQSVQCVRNILAHDIVNTLASLDPNILSIALTTLQQSPPQVKQPIPYTHIGEAPHYQQHYYSMTSNSKQGTRIPEYQKNEAQDMGTALPERVLSPSEFTSSSILSTSSSSSNSNASSGSNNSSTSNFCFSSEDSYARPLKKRRISFMASREEEEEEGQRQNHPSASRSHQNDDQNCQKQHTQQQQLVEYNEEEKEGAQVTSTRPIKPTSKLMKLGITSTPTLRKRMIKVLFENRHEEPMVWDEILSKIPGNRAKIWSTLCLFVNEGFVVQSGKGRRGLPFKYRLAECVTEEHFEMMEPQWKIIDAEGKVVHRALQEERRRKRRLLKQQSKKPPQPQPQHHPSFEAVR